MRITTAAAASFVTSAPNNPNPNEITPEMENETVEASLRTANSSDQLEEHNQNQDHHHQQQQVTESNERTSDMPSKMVETMDTALSLLTSTRGQGESPQPPSSSSSFQQHPLEQVQGVEEYSHASQFIGTGVSLQSPSAVHAPQSQSQQPPPTMMSPSVSHYDIDSTAIPHSSQEVLQTPQTQTHTLYPNTVTSTATSITHDNAATANVSSMLEAAGFGHDTPMPPPEWSERTKRLALDLEEFVEKALEGIRAYDRGEGDAPSEEAVADLQLQTARMLRTVRIYMIHCIRTRVCLCLSAYFSNRVYIT